MPGRGTCFCVSLIVAFALAAKSISMKADSKGLLFQTTCTGTHLLNAEDLQLQATQRRAEAACRVDPFWASGPRKQGNAPKKKTLPAFVRRQCQLTSFGWGSMERTMGMNEEL